jgi:lysophospholipase L1-like esterase
MQSKAKRRLARHTAMAIVCMLAALGLADAAHSMPADGRPGTWVGSWGTALMVPSAKTALKPDELADVTLRQIVRLSLGGRQLRVRISNLFGDAPLVIGAGTVGRAVAPGKSTVAGPAQALRFGGAAGVVVPPGAEYDSDPIDSSSAAGEDLAVSLFFKSLPARQSAHMAAHSTQFIAHGDQSARASLDDARVVTAWFQISGVDVLPDSPAGLVVAIGDSITDGSGSTQDGNNRWTDFLQQRIAGKLDEPMAVINAGIGGNRMLHDDIGPQLSARFDRDVLRHPGVTHAVVLIGVNDLGRLHRSQNESPATRAAMLASLQSSWRDLARRAHAQGVCLIGATLTPYGGSSLYRPGPQNETDRQALNQWIRSADLFDGVADFDAAVRDPATRDRLQEAYDSGDHLHLSPAGYRAMAQAVPLDRLAPCGAHQDGHFDIAITVDDLPSHGTLPPGMTRLGIAQSYRDTLKAHHVPEAFGFVNAAKFGREPESETVLDAWRKAGYPLGNHTFSHMNLSRAPSLEAWENDVVEGEPAVAARMQGADWHYLRFPNLSVGSDAAIRDGALAFLKGRGYRVADVSVAFGDWDYTDAYARCLAKGDGATIEAMKTRYLKGVDDSIAQMKATSRRIYGRVIPQVLLTHLGGWSAVTLPEVMDKLDAAGAHYVTLAQTQSDPAYVHLGGGNMMSRTARENGVQLSDIPGAQSAAEVKSFCQ